MARQKTTQAKHFGIRLNPATSELDARTLAIIQNRQQQGYSFKAIAQDAILRYGGMRPEMFNDPSQQNARLLAGIERMLSDFGERLLAEYKRTGGRYAPSDDTQDDEEGGVVSGFAANFARSFMQRQAQGDE